MLLRVTKEDIRKGIPEDADSCPIAHALLRRGFRHVFVNQVRISVDGCRIKTPAKAREFIAEFDANFCAQPIAFRIPLKPPPAKGKKGRE